MCARALSRLQVFVIRPEGMQMVILYTEKGGRRAFLSETRQGRFLFGST